MLALLLVRGHFPIKRIDSLFRKDRDLTELDRGPTPTRRPFEMFDCSESVAEVHVAYWACGTKYKAAKIITFIVLANPMRFERCSSLELSRAIFTAERLIASISKTKVR